MNQQNSNEQLEFASHRQSITSLLSRTFHDLK